MKLQASTADLEKAGIERPSQTALDTSSIVSNAPDERLVRRRPSTSHESPPSARTPSPVDAPADSLLSRSDSYELLGVGSSFPSPPPAYDDGNQQNHVAEQESEDEHNQQNPWNHVQEQDPEGEQNHVEQQHQNHARQSF